MTCKFCNAQIDDGTVVCPVCGLNLEEQPQAETVQEEVVETVQEEVVAEAVVEEAAEATAEEMPASEEAIYEAPPKRKKKVLPAVLGITGAVIGLSVLASLLTITVLMALGVVNKDSFKLPENDIFRKDAYAVSAEDAEEATDDVVATMGDAKLTNAQLQIFYRMVVQDFLDSYGSYLTSLSLDFTKPLSEQTCYFNEEMSWEQYFLSGAIKTWTNYQALALSAEAAGFQLDAELDAELATIPESLEAQAQEGNYESADAMIKEVLGAGCTLEDYMLYIRLNALANEYYATEYEKMIPSEADLEAYYQANEATFAESGVNKEDLSASVRHILVCPKGGTLAEDGYTMIYTDEEWAECLEKAETILDEWKNGEATEESFAELVETYTEDTGSATTGGLYENINPTSSYVENFLNWSVDTTRQVGDTGIVQTEYGYHIMYYVSGEPYWRSVAEVQYVSEKSESFFEKLEKDWPAKVTYKKIVLAELDLA